MSAGIGRAKKSVRKVDGFKPALAKCDKDAACWVHVERLKALDITQPPGTRQGRKGKRDRVVDSLTMTCR